MGIVLSWVSYLIIFLLITKFLLDKYRIKKDTTYLFLILLVIVALQSLFPNSFVVSVLVNIVGIIGVVSLVAASAVVIVLLLIFLLAPILVQQQPQPGPPPTPDDDPTDLT